MQLLTIVEAYINAALERAVVEEVEDGMVGAYVPGCPGIVAYGVDVHECTVDLYRLLEEWIQVSLVQGQPLPVIGGIDLNSEASRILTTYHPDKLAPRGEFFENEDELEAAFDRWDKEDLAHGSR